MIIRIPIAESVINVFKKDYKNLRPKKIFKMGDEYLVFAPVNAEDINDPFYRVNLDDQHAYPFIMKNPNQLSNIMHSDPIWSS